jgi:DNA-binding LytR/AlgR family response regulator
MGFMPLGHLFMPLWNKLIAGAYVMKPYSLERIAKALNEH